MASKIFLPMKLLQRMVYKNGGRTISLCIEDGDLYFIEAYVAIRL